MSYAMPPSSYRTLSPERKSRGVRAWDVALTVVLIVLLTVFTLLASYGGFLFAFASDACGSVRCDAGTMTFGMWFAVISPWVVLLAAVAAAVALLVTRRIAFWVPVAAAGLDVALWFVAAAIVGAAIGTPQG